MKRCVYCGAEMEDQAAYCTRCGKAAGTGGENFQPYGTYGQPGGVPYQNQRYYGESGRYNGMAIASLVLGLISIFFNAFYLVPSILAIIFGILGRSQIKKNPSCQGMGMATAGLVLGIVFLAIYLLIIVLSMVAFSNLTTHMDFGEIFEMLEEL